MKLSLGVSRVLVIVFVAFLAAKNGVAQGAVEPEVQEIDTRAWNQSYWLKMAELGLVEVAPAMPCREAIYTSSRIDAPGVATDDSPDVPVTTEPNTTQSENSVFIHPLDINILLNSNNSTDWDGSSVNVLYGADALYTTDGGTTWGGQIAGAGGYNSGDPAAVIGRNGWYYVGYVADDYGQGVAYSTDDGTSWTHVQVAAGGYLLDKNHLWIDNSTLSPYEGNMYSAWTNFQGGANYEDIELCRSTDNGLTWSSRINISSAVSSGSHDQGVNIQTGPNGEVYAAWAIYDSWPSDETAIGFARSTDGGATFEPASRIIENIRGIRTTTTSKNMRVNSFPVMAVDISGGPSSGTIYLVWPNIGVPGVNVGPDIDVYMIKSIDSGSTWSTPVKVNQDSSGLGKEHFFPWITCDPVLGALSVIFYDDRNVSSSDCETFVATSVDSGVTWNDFKVSDVSFTPSPIPGLAGGYFGDYLGISARGGRVYPAWTDNRDGRAMTYVSPFALEEDTIPPGDVTDLTVIDNGSDWISLTWTASGDDGNSGTASSYDIRYSTSLIDSSNFDMATPVSDPPTPQEAGSTEVFTVDGLDFNTVYYFALKVYDEWGNASGVSNCPSETTLGIPDISVSPDSLVDSLLTGETSVHTLTIRNLGQDPSTLDFLFPQYSGELSLRVASRAIPWLSVNPTQGTVTAGDSADITITFDASGLYGGDYYADLIIASNDPDEPEVTVPVHLHVTGAPDIAVSEDTLDYGVVFIGAAVTDTLIVRNEGTDLLTVSDIVSDNSDYTVDTTNFSLDPEEYQEVLVTFAPSVSGTIAGTLIITSDDPDEPSVTVALIGEGLEPPDISVNPDSLSDSLLTGETSTQWLTIYNEGYSDLIFDIMIEMSTAGNDLSLSSKVNFEVNEIASERRAMPVKNSLTAERSEAKFAKKIYRSGILTPALDSILVMEEGPGQYHYDTALNNLGLSRTLVTSWGDLLSELIGGTEWDMVIVNSYSNFPSNEVLDTLDAYQANGGLLIYTDWGLYSYSTHPLLASMGISYVSYFTIPINFYAVDSGHPLFNNPNDVSSFYWTDDQYNIDGEIVNVLAGATQLAYFQGYPTNGAIVLNDGQNCLFNAFQAMNFNADNDGDGRLDIVELIENEILFLSGAFNWIAVDPDSGTVPAGDSINIEVTFDATGLYGGDYFADIVITSNDPDEPEVIVPAHLHVTGAPDIAVSEDTLDYGVVFIGAAVTDTLIVRNEGTDLLTVSDIVSDNSDYTVDTTNFSLDPEEYQEVLVTFTPSAVGMITGTLTISSDDPDEPTVTVALIGEGVEPPDIMVTPDSLSDSLLTGETSTQWLTIYNEGYSDLIFDITIEERTIDSQGKVAFKIVHGNGKRTAYSTARMDLTDDESRYNRKKEPYNVTRLPRTKIFYSSRDGRIEETFGSWANTWTGSLRDRGNVFHVVTATTLNEVRFYMDIPVSTQMYFVVYEGDNLEGTYVQKEEIYISASGTGEGWYSSGPMDVDLLVGKYYYIGTSWEGEATYGRGTEPVPLPTSFGTLETGIPGTLAGFPPSSTINQTWTGYSPYYQTIVTGEGITWLVLDTTSGTIPAGDSMTIEVTFDATGLYGGDYFADIVITSNDPDEPEVIVPAHLHVTGAPDIAVSEDTLNFGSVIIDSSVTDTLIVFNEGTDLLTVSDIVSDHSDYTVDTTSFSLAPEESLQVLVTFTPSAVGSITGTLTITSDDPDEPTVTVALVGEGVTGIEEAEVGVPKIFSVSQNVPNPFNQQTLIRYACPCPSLITLKIFDVTGILITTLLDEEMGAGYHSVIWNGEDQSGKKAASGIYYLKFMAVPVGPASAGDKVRPYSVTEKLLLIR